MSDSRHENESGLIIDPALLASIQAACRRRAAELEEAASANRGSSSEQEAERFAAAVSDMPAPVRRFFQAEEAIGSPRQSESAQDRLESAKRVPASGAGLAARAFRAIQRAVFVRWRGVMKFLHHVLHELDKYGTFVIAVLCVLFFLYLLRSEGDDR